MSQTGLEKPSHRTARLRRLEAVNNVGSEHEFGQATQREAAAKWGVDRSTVIHVCRTAKQGALDALAASVPGRAGQSAEQAALAAARAEIERLRATVTEQAVILHLQQGKSVWD